MSVRKRAASFTLVASLLCTVAHSQTEMPKSDVPPKLTLCDLYTDPRRYSGHIIQVRAAVAGYPNTRLDEAMFARTPTCTSSGYMSIALELPPAVKPKPEFQLVEDESYKEFKRAIQSPVQVEATLEGRLDAVFIWRNQKRERLSGGEGFGKKHDKDARLVLHRVLGVETRSVPRL